MCEKHTMMKRQKIVSLSLNIFMVSLYKIFTHFCLDFSLLGDNGNHYFLKEILYIFFFLQVASLISLYYFFIFRLYINE